MNSTQLRMDVRLLLMVFKEAKMKVLIVNSVCGIRSTGRICTDLAEALSSQGHEVHIAYGREHVPPKYEKYAVRIGNEYSVKVDILTSRLLDNAGFNSKTATKAFVAWIREYDPDVIHLHNVHGYYMNIEILFEYLKDCGKKIIWTMHDCWPFTGHCSYFDFANCYAWQTGCEKCVQKKEYPTSCLISRSKSNYARKKEIFTNVPNLTIITPSNWLAGLVKRSFLGEYPVRVIHNGIDTTVFKPTHSNILSRYHLENKKIVLGVAAFWSQRKGLSYFVQLAELLPKQYQIVLIGLSKKQCMQLPNSIIGLQKTNNVQELVEWYSAATVYVNPTLEENYPTTNIEAQACGTPVITFNTGGSIESAVSFGTVVEQGDVEGIVRCIETESYQKGELDRTIQGMLRRYLMFF